MSTNSARRFHGRSLSNGLVVTLVVAGLTSVMTANWHGIPLYRSTEGLGLLGIAAAGFFAGGVVAGRHRRRPRGALWQGLGVGALAVLVLAAAALFRLALLQAGIPSATRLAQVLLGACILTTVSCLGALCGRALYRWRQHLS